MFLISFELIRLRINILITYLNDPEDHSDPYSGYGTVPSDLLLDVGASCLSEFELILACFSATMDDFTINAALRLAGFALSSLPLAAMLPLRNLLHSGGLWMTHQLHPPVDGAHVALDRQL